MKHEAVTGTISSAGFANGHRFVIGRWDRSPVGPLVDVMWGQPDGTRTLLADSDAGAEFITSIYDFDRVEVCPLTVTGDNGRTDVEATVEGRSLTIHLVGGRRFPLPLPRPLVVTRFIEAPIARAVMGVETYGVSPTGVREWYQSRGWRWVVDGRARWNGTDLGPPGPIHQPMGVGFSEPPPRPSIVAVTTVINRTGITGNGNEANGSEGNGSEGNGTEGNGTA